MTTAVRRRLDYPVAQVEGLLARFVPMYRHAVRAALRQCQDAIPEDALRLALTRKDVEAALAAVPLERFTAALLPAVERVFLLSMAAAGRETALPVRKATRRRDQVPGQVSSRFDLTNPRAVDAARRYSYDLVTNVTAETRAALRNVIEYGQRGLATVEQQARRIRDLVGVTAPQAEALGRFEAGLREDGDLSEAQVEARVARQTEAYVADRAETIARSETIRALNVGQSELWAQAQEAGLLGVDASRVWIAEPTACELCADLDGTTVGLDEPWTASDGEEVMNPPKHPRCKCGQGIVDPGTVQPGEEEVATVEGDEA